MKEIKDFFSNYSKLAKVMKKLDKIRGKNKKAQAIELTKEITKKMEELRKMIENKKSTANVIAESFFGESKVEAAGKKSIRLNVISVTTLDSKGDQVIVRTKDENIFFSYATPIVVVKKGKVYLNEDYWDYSATTGKYRNKFLGVSSKKEIMKKIKSGEYKVVKFM